MSSAVRSFAQSSSKLSKTLAHLNASPKLSLSGVKSLKLTFAFSNDHFGARHFAKEQLPRIRWANPELDIQVDRVKKSQEHEWRPEIELEFLDGQQKNLNIQGKWSTAILKDLMEVAGGSSWQEHKAEAVAAGRPIIPGEEKESLLNREHIKTHLPSLKRFREKAATTQAPIPKSPTPGVELNAASSG